MPGSETKRTYPSRDQVIAVPSWGVRARADSTTGRCMPESSKPFLPRHNVDQKVELIGFGECFGDVCAREGTAFIRVCNDERAGRDFGYEDWWHYRQTSSFTQRTWGRKGKGVKQGSMG